MAHFKFSKQTKYILKELTSCATIDSYKCESESVALPLESVTSIRLSAAATAAEDGNPVVSLSGLTDGTHRLPHPTKP